MFAADVTGATKSQTLFEYVLSKIEINYKIPKQIPKNFNTKSQRYNLK